MKIYNWDLQGFENAYSRYYYMPHLNSCVDGVDEHGHFHSTLGECGKASCVCAFEDEIITYSRLFFEGDTIFQTRAENVINQLNIPIGSSIFVAGCGFGYLMEALSEKRMNVSGCDNSPYIHFNTETESTFPIHNVDVEDVNFVNLIREATGIMYFDYIITEDILTSYNSYDVIFNNLEGILKVNKPKTNIINIVDTNCSEPFTTKTIEEWQSVNQNYTWLNFYAKTN
jgi:hypothetical protein